MKTVPPPSTSTSRPPASGPLGLDRQPALVGQAIAAIGAALSLLGPFSDVVAGIGVAALIVGVILAAPAGRFPGPVMVEWWSLLAISALAVLAGFGLGFWLTALGGVILTAGAITALVAVFFGTPVRPE